MNFRNDWFKNLDTKEIHRLQQDNYKYGRLQSYMHLGTINFLFDKSFEPYVSIGNINDFFGTSKSTTGAKSKQIRNLLKLGSWNNEFSTKKMQDSNPFANLVMVDGLIIPVNTLPEQYQIAVRQARAEGKDISFKTR